MYSFTPFYSSTNAIPSTSKLPIMTNDNNRSWESEGYSSSTSLTKTTRPNYASSISSSSSSSNEYSEEILTPPTSPDVIASDTTSTKKTHNLNSISQTKTLDDYQLSLDTLSLSTPPISPPSSPIPSSGAHLKPLTSTKSSSTKSRVYEEAHRGRSRWPRLLWKSSALDEPSLVVLKEYFARAVGEELPILTMEMSIDDDGISRGVGSKAVRQWSEAMEKGGL